MPANINSPQQTVVSGHREASERLVSWLEKNVEGSFRAIPLKVSAPFHSTLMKPAQEKLANHFETVIFSENKIPYIANIDAKIYGANTVPDQIKSNCINQVSGSVLWSESFDFMVLDSIHWPPTKLFL